MFYDRNKEKIIDIILFGSVVKGKEKPKDIDLLLLFKDKKDIDLGYKLKKVLLDYNVEVVMKSYRELLKSDFKVRESILSEGFSLIQKNFLSSGFGYVSLILFRYELKKFNKSNRMRFYYSLYGRGKESGMLKRLNLIKFSDTVLLCPIENMYKVIEYLSVWKVNYIKFPILIPERIKNLLK